MLRLHVDIAGAEPELDRGRPALDREARGAGHHGRQRLRPAHAAEARREDPAPGERAAVVAPAHLDEGFVGALHDALGADVDPGAGRHLAVHHQPLAIELGEMLPGRPARHEVRVRDQDARRVGMGPEHADRLAGLDQKRPVGIETLQRMDDAIEAFPVARRPADAAIDHEFARLLGDVGVEVVHQHPHRGFGQPGFRGDLGPAGRADGTGIVEAGHGRLQRLLLPARGRRWPGEARSYEGKHCG